MKIAIVAPSPVPFLVGGAERLFWGLTGHINTATPHDAELIKVPCLDRRFWPLMEAYRAFDRLDLGYFDMVLSTKYPAWMVRHPNHHVYLQHTCRGVYDLYFRRGLPLRYEADHPALKPLDEILRSPPDRGRVRDLFKEVFRHRNEKGLRKHFVFPGPLTRAVIHWLDRAALNPDQIRNYNAISANVAGRADYFPPGAQIRVIHHPPDTSGFRCAPGGYVFTASRLEKLKRIDLLIEAFSKVKTDFKLCIAGTGGQEELLRRMAADDPRVCFLGYVPDHELLDHYARALFVPFVPYDEDFGLITVEAMASGKPVVTCTDSGGVAELVRHRKTGLVVPPEPDHLARAMQELISRPDETVQMGVRARESVAGINWENTVQTLLGERKPAVIFPVPARRKVVMVSTFPVGSADSGGKKRAFYLARELSRHVDVTVLSLAPARDPLGRERLFPGVFEIAVPRSREHQRRDREFKEMAGASAQDISAIEGCPETPQFLEELEVSCRDADLAVLAHPYLYNALRRVYPGPVWYDAHNVEYDMKNSVLPEGEFKGRHMDLVFRVEEAASKNAEALLAVSGADAARLAELYRINPEKILVVPNGMDFALADRHRLSRDRRRDLKKRLGLDGRLCALFVGSDHGPNVQAALALAEMAGECPGVLFIVAGSVCRVFEEKKPVENVQVLGVVDEAEKMVALNAADIGLNPVTAGAGSNLKVLEYIAFGLPVLSTPFGLRGHDLVPDLEVLRAEPDQFPGVLKWCAEQGPENLAPLAERALDRARKDYDWSRTAAPAVRLLGAG